MTNFEKYKFDLDAAARAFTAKCRAKDCYMMCMQLNSIIWKEIARKCLTKWSQQEAEDKNDGR